MDENRENAASRRVQQEKRPILLVPHMWIGDFVRCHSVVTLLKARWPSRPIDIVATPLTSPLVEYMPGIRQAIVADLRHRRLSLRVQADLVGKLRRNNYATAIVLPRKWKAALAPFLAGIPERIGYFGEWRFILINAARWDERKLPRLVDRYAALALPADEPMREDLPAPRMSVSQVEIADWSGRRALAQQGTIVALAPGAVGPSKRWPVERYGALASALARDGYATWIVGGPEECALARDIVRTSCGAALDLTGPDLRSAILALAAADIAIANDSGLLHVAAAVGTPTIGIFGPTSPWHWAPLNTIEAALTAPTLLPCQPCHRPACRLHHHQCMRDVSPDRVLATVRRVLERS